MKRQKPTDEMVKDNATTSASGSGTSSLASLILFLFCTQTLAPAVAGMSVVLRASAVFHSSANPTHTPSISRARLGPRLFKISGAMCETEPFLPCNLAPHPIQVLISHHVGKLGSQTCWHAVTSAKQPGSKRQDLACCWLLLCRQRVACTGFMTALSLNLPGQTRKSLSPFAVLARC